MNTKNILPTLAVVALTCVRALAFPEVNINGVEGFQDTPMEPDGKWHVHDPARPQPPRVTTGKFSEEAAPPSDAIVLFDGTDLSHWRDKKTGDVPAWTIKGNAMVSAKGDIISTNEFGDMQLHLEFREPELKGRYGQDRGRSEE